MIAIIPAIINGEYFTTSLIGSISTGAGFSTSLGFGLVFSTTAGFCFSLNSKF